MEEFPFTSREWARVCEEGDRVLKASLMDDPVLAAVYFEKLRLVLARLRTRYGEHPVLLETEADYLPDDPPACVALYRRACRIALAGGLPTYSIRIALAYVLLEDLGQPGPALQELLACQADLPLHADAWEQKQWAELAAECSRQARTESG